MRGIHKHRPRGASLELKKVFEDFYGTPAGKKYQANKHIDRDKKRAKDILEKILQDKDASVSYTKRVPKVVDEL